MGDRGSVAAQRIRIEEMLELTHHSFVAYTLPATGEVVPMLQVASSKTDAERLLLVSPELGEVLTAIIFRVRAGKSCPAAGVRLRRVRADLEPTDAVPVPTALRHRGPAPHPQLHPGVPRRHIAGRPDHRRRPAAAVAPPRLQKDPTPLSCRVAI